jgi:hypothetical protein
MRDRRLFDLSLPASSAILLHLSFLSMNREFSREASGPDQPPAVPTLDAHLNLVGGSPSQIQILEDVVRQACSKLGISVLELTVRSVSSPQE